MVDLKLTENEIALILENRSLVRSLEITDKALLDMSKAK